MSARVHLPLPKYEETDLFEHEGRPGCALRKCWLFSKVTLFAKGERVVRLSVRRGAVGTASKFDFYGIKSGAGLFIHERRLLRRHQVP